MRVVSIRLIRPSCRGRDELAKLLRAHLIEASECHTEKEQLIHVTRRGLVAAAAADGASGRGGRRRRVR